MYFRVVYTPQVSLKSLEQTGACKILSFLGARWCARGFLAGKQNLNWNPF